MFDILIEGLKKSLIDLIFPPIQYALLPKFNPKDIHLQLPKDIPCCCMGLYGDIHLSVIKWSNYGLIFNFFMHEVDSIFH